MPAFVTHALFGEAVLAHLPNKKIAELLTQNQEAFFWGLQGPDLLFYRRSLAEYGRQMHRERAADLLCTAARYLVFLKGATEYPTVLAYFYGFLCHYSLDVHLHPYVYYHQYRKEEKTRRRLRGIHHRIESDIDTQYYALVKEQPISEYRIPPGYGKDTVLCNSIARLYTYLLYKVYNVEVEDQTVLKAFGSTGRLINLCLRPGPLYGLAVVGEWLVGRRAAATSHVRRKKCRGDVLNQNHHRWYLPGRSHMPCTLSVEDLMLSARRDALQRIAFFTEALEKNTMQFEKVTFPPFNNGFLPQTAENHSKKIGSSTDGDAVQART